MKRLIIIPLMLLCLGATAQKTGDWAQYGRYEKHNAMLRITPEVVFMGNSITDFWVNNDPAFFVNNNFVDRGISGQTTCEMLARFRQDVIELHPKVVVILAGINDIAGNNGEIKLENVAKNIFSMCDLARFHDIKVVICSVLPCDRFGWRPGTNPSDEVKRLNGMLKKFAEDNGIIYADYYRVMATETGGMPEFLSSDGCHPNIHGYLVMEPIVADAIDKTMGGGNDYYVTPAMN